MEDIQSVDSADSLVKPLSLSEGAKNKIIWLVALVFVLGTVSGWGLFRTTSKQEGAFGGGGAAQLVEGEKVETGKVYGSGEEEAFSDNTKGVIEVNEEGGEGTHVLMREGGDSQTVYLTSSVLDLEMFVGRQVEVWGQTFSSEKVGWLMDFGRIKVLE